MTTLQRIYRSTAVGDNNGGGIAGMEPGFLIRGIVIDNPSGSWVKISPTDQYIAPYTFGWATAVLPGSQVMAVQYVAGPIPGANSASLAGVPLVAYLYDQEILNSPGEPFVSAAPVLPVFQYISGAVRPTGGASCIVYHNKSAVATCFVTRFAVYAFTPVVVRQFFAMQWRYLSSITTNTGAVITPRAYDLRDPATPLEAFDNSNGGTVSGPTTTTAVYHPIWYPQGGDATPTPLFEVNYGEASKPIVINPGDFVALFGVIASLAAGATIAVEIVVEVST